MSAAEAARRLGTTIPRVKRAITRLGMPVAQGRGGRVTIDEAQFAALRNELGLTAPQADHTRAEIAVLATLARAPFGLVSARAVARQAGLSPTAASRAVKVVVARGLVARVSARIAAGGARDVELLHPVRTSADWQRLAPGLAVVEPPARACPAGDVVPGRLRHLFWNTAPAQLDVARSGGSIARRLLQTLDPEGLAWGAEHLTAVDWRHAARTRGIDPRTRRLAENLAADLELR